jgi:hypothetical protein
MIIYEIIVIIFILSYREVGILCDRSSWRFNWFQHIFWQIDQDSNWKNFDWFHFSNGLMTLLICHIGSDKIYSLPVFWGVYTSTVIYWVTWMWIRNIFIHIIIPMPSRRRWWFIVPIFGGALEKSNIQFLFTGQHLKG